MALRVRAIIRSLFDGKSDLEKLATGGAWLFAIGSLFPLLWLISDGGAYGAVFRTTVGDHARTIPLLSYSGGIGMLLIWTEILAVAGSFILTAAPRVPMKLARVGHGVLVAWSLLWTLGTWRLATYSPGFWTFQALFLSVLCGCTIWRAWRNWAPTIAQPMATEAQPAMEPNYFRDTDSQARSTPASDPDTPTRQQIAEALERARVAAIAASRKILVGVKAGINAARDHSAKT
jgi:hypothetical protein